MFDRAINSLFFLGLLFVVSAPAAVYGQRETRDRPDTVGSRSIGGKDAAESRRDRKAAEDPARKINEQLRSKRSTPNVAKMAGAGLTTAAYEDAIELALSEYETKFKTALENETFKNSHAFIRLEDFARAYIIWLDPRVQARITTPYDLAVLRSQTTTYDDYDEILTTHVPDLNKEQAKALAKNAKKVVKAALSND